MTLVLGVSCSSRKNGFTATLLKTLLESARTVHGIRAEMIYPTDYDFGPCKSCFNCIRDPKHTCSLDDDFGRKGEGVLFKKVKEAKALAIASPVHNFGISSMAHVFLERLYPFVWSGFVNGMPFAGITCASNQGMQHEAMQELCRISYTLTFRWVDGLSVHTCYYKKALTEAKVLGIAVANSAKENAKRRLRFTDTERMLHYQSSPWKPLGVILKNLEMIDESIKTSSFKRKEAAELLRMAGHEHAEAMHYYCLMNHEKAIHHLSLALSYWARATWSEYLETKIMKVRVPEAYRPIRDNQV